MNYENYLSHYIVLRREFLHPLTKDRFHILLLTWAGFVRYWYSSAFLLGALYTDLQEAFSVPMDLLQQIALMEYSGWKSCGGTNLWIILKWILELFYSPLDTALKLKRLSSASKDHLNKIPLIKTILYFDCWYVCSRKIS